MKIKKHMKMLGMEVTDRVTGFQRILEIVRTWQHGFHWRALQDALEDGKRDDLPDEQRTLDHLLFRSWSKQSNEVREYLRENAPRLLKLMPPVDWGNDLLRYDPDGLTREMVELEGELLAMRADPAKPTATEGAKLNGADKTRRKVRRPDSFTDADDKIISALLEHHELP